MAQPKLPNDRNQTNIKPHQPKQEDVSTKKNPKRDSELSDVDDSDMGMGQKGYGTTQGEGF